MAALAELVSSDELLAYKPCAAPVVLERPESVEADAVVPGFRLEMERLWAK